MLLPSSLGLSLVAKLSSLFVQRGVQMNAQEQPRKRRNRCQQKFFDGSYNRSVETAVLVSIGPLRQRTRRGKYEL
jgi:hypothetical protein